MISLQELEASLKSMKQIELRSIFFICTEMGGISVVVETSFFDFYCLSFTQPILTWKSALSHLGVGAIKLHLILDEPTK